MMEITITKKDKEYQVDGFGGKTLVYTARKAMWESVYRRLEKLGIRSVRLEIRIE